MSSFRFDAAAVLRAVSALAEQAVAGTISPERKRAWAREHDNLFKFPPALECADHIERVAKYSRTVERTVENVLGRERVKAGW